MRGSTTIWVVAIGAMTAFSQTASSQYYSGYAKAQEENLKDSGQDGMTKALKVIEYFQNAYPDTLSEDL